MKIRISHLAMLAAIPILASPEVAVAQGGGTGAVQIDLSVTQQATNVVVYSGVANVCDENQQNCVLAEAGCGAVAADPNNILPVDEDEKAEFIAANFPYATNQDLLQSDFQVDTGGCGLDPFQTRGISASPD